MKIGKCEFLCVRCGVLRRDFDDWRVRVYIGTGARRDTPYVTRVRLAQQHVHRLRDAIVRSTPRAVCRRRIRVAKCVQLLDEKSSRALKLPPMTRRWRARNGCRSTTATRLALTILATNDSQFLTRASATFRCRFCRFYDTLLVKLAIQRTILSHDFLLIAKTTTRRPLSVHQGGDNYNSWCAYFCCLWLEYLLR